MKQIKKYIKKHRIAAIIIMFLTVAAVIPFLINSVFKSNWGIPWLQAEWLAGDALGFCGAILAAIATIVGVHLSIQYAYCNSREDEINKVKPYLALTHYHAKVKVDLISAALGGTSKERETTAEYYKEYKLDKIFISITSKGIIYTDALDTDQQELIQKQGLIFGKDENNVMLLKAKQFISMPFDIENVGNGAALNVMVCFYKEKTKPKGTNLYTLKCNQNAYVHIFSDVQDDSILGKYVFELIYNDILGNKYSQKYPVILEKDKKINRVYEQIELTGKQIRTEEV